MMKAIIKKLTPLYGRPASLAFSAKLEKIIKKSSKKKTIINQKDIALITYANSIAQKREKSLTTINKFAKKVNLKSSVNTIHVLPFYPWDTDRGFSVLDYYKVHNDYGDWKDISTLSRYFNLMFDFVANHASIDNPLVQNALIERHLDKNDPRYKDYENYNDFVIAYDEKRKPTDADLKNLARPRPNPVLTPYVVYEENKKLRAILGTESDLRKNQKTKGRGLVWTTFSRSKGKDGKEETRQVDLNFRNPNVLLETIKILLFYIQRGAKLIRLDAIGYIWKKSGSSSLHEKEAHKILEVIHDILVYVSPQAITISEVNESQDKFFEYLGRKSHEESDMVYQFCAFPLAIYAVLTGDANPYKKWMPTTTKFKGRQFITVLGSHDGLGLKPVRDILSDNQLKKLTRILADENKCLPNFAILPGGKKIIYEICATPWNLVNPENSKESFDAQLAKYLAVLALGLVVRGIPGIYINGLLGTKNYHPKKGLDENRTVNREVFSASKLLAKLKKANSREARVFNEVMKLLKIRSKEPAFDPKAPTPQILETNNKSVISLAIKGKNKKEKIFSLINVSGKKQNIAPPKVLKNRQLKDLISNKKYTLSDSLSLEPYTTLWLK